MIGPFQFVIAWFSGIVLAILTLIIAIFMVNAIVHNDLKLLLIGLAGICLVITIWLGVLP